MVSQELTTIIQTLADSGAVSTGSIAFDESSTGMDLEGK
jgi:hypothetical protein